RRDIPVTASRDSLIRYFREWEHGRNTPKVPYRDLLCELYGKTAEELGISTAPPQARSDIGLIYAPSLADTLSTVSNLALFDAQRHPGVVTGHFSEEAIYAACLDWLFSSSSEGKSGSTSSRVTKRDVDEISATTMMFDRMDRSFGGEQSRDLAVKYLHDHVVPKLSGAYDDRIGRDLFHAAAVLCEVIGYMAYDADKHALGQRYLIQSLRLAKEADDPAYGAYVLTTMSHQAMYLGRNRESLRLAQAAGQSYTGTHAIVVQTEAAMHEAIAYGALGDGNAAARALLKAERAFARQVPGTGPDWAAHWGDTVFAAFSGRIWLDLGNATQARPHLTMAAADSKGQPRRVVYSSVQLANLTLLEGDAEQAAKYAVAAADAVVGLKSKRSQQVVRDLRAKFEQRIDVKPLQEFLTRAHDLSAE
ncbi:hypothetical protein ACFFQW_47910, partial [Umezawaea endophytica]